MTRKQLHFKVMRSLFRGEVRETTLGRLLFNEIFPDDFTFQDATMTKKRLQQVMALVYQRYGPVQTALIADDLKDIGFFYATVSGLSMGMGDFQEVPGVIGAIDKGEVRRIQLANNLAKALSLKKSGTV